MNKSNNIHNLDSLEREIYRLRLEAKQTGDKLDNQFYHLQKNFFPMLIRSFRCKKVEQFEFIASLVERFFRKRREV